MATPSIFKSNYFSVKTTRTGKTFPSRSSIEAPPPRRKYLHYHKSVGKTTLLFSLGFCSFFYKIRILQTLTGGNLISLSMLQVLEGFYTLLNFLTRFVS